MNKINDIINKNSIMVLDGAFSTELEAKGYNLDDPLWSAKFLIDSPEAIVKVHKDYLNAGADCIITASYQATFEGFMKRGLSEIEARDLIKLSVTIAKNTRDKFWSKPENQIDRLKPLVAASVGPYGAYLADGSEYRGNYNIDEKELIEFHKKRLETLISAKPDILACETIPCLIEAKALTNLLEKYPEISAWISFSAKDGKHINSGEKIEECAKFLDRYKQVKAIGVNCTAPQYVESLIGEIRKGTDKPIIVYPNLGETYDPSKKVWNGSSCDLSYNEYALKWYEKGARIIGGCCRTTPEDIHKIAKWKKR